MIRVISSFLALLFLTGCVPANGPVVNNPDSVPTEPPLVLTTPDVNDPTMQDAIAFAEEIGITIEEALLRLEHQETIGTIQPRLMADLPDTYGGLWVEHQPRYRIVIALTQGDRKTILPYIDEQSWADLVEIQPVRHSLHQLRVDQGLVMHFAQRTGVAVNSALDVKENRVEVYVGNPDLWLSNLSSRDIDLPDTVVILASQPHRPLPDTNQGVLLTTTAVDGRTIYLPTQPPSGVSMMALMEGELIEVNGCLRIVSWDHANGFLILWPHATDLRVTDTNIDVLDESLHVIARAGEPLRIAGGAMESEMSMARFDDLIPGLPLPDCPGPYWVAGEVETLVAQSVPDIYVDPFSSGDEILALYLQQSRSSVNRGQIAGELVVDTQKCMRVGEYAILWPPDVFPREAPLRMVDMNGQTLGLIGGHIQLSGQEKGPEDYRFFDSKVPCSGPYWGVAEVIQP